MKTLAQQQQAFDALSDATRLRMAHLLVRANTAICQCEFVDALEVSPANVSRHAKILLQAELFEERREGKWVYYQLTKEAANLLRAVCHGHDPTRKDDLQRFQERLKLRQAGKCLLGVQNRRFR